jgi:mono/diheme cytochrome c family protein
LSTGARVYSDNCGRCHNPRAPGEFSDRAWSVIVHHLHARGYLTAGDTVAVLVFLRASNGSALEISARETPASASVDAAALVVQKGCKGCHTIGGVGALAIQARSFPRTPGSWRRRVRNGKNHTGVRPDSGSSRRRPRGWR